MLTINDESAAQDFTITIKHVSRHRLDSDESGSLMRPDHVHPPVGKMTDLGRAFLTGIVLNVGTSRADKSDGLPSAH